MQRYAKLCNAMQCYAMLCNALLAVLSFAMHDLPGGAMLCIAILSFALHCIALHVHAFGRKNTPNWGRAGFIYFWFICFFVLFLYFFGIQWIS